MRLSEGIEKDIEMIKPIVLSVIGKQIQHEQSNARAYEAASLYFGRMNLPGLEAFMARQALEERMHADKLIAHVSDRGGAVELLTLPAPRTDFASPLDAAGFVRDLERTTTEAIHRLFALARNDADYPLEVLPSRGRGMV
jgi:ferritin